MITDLYRDALEEIEYRSRIITLQPDIFEGTFSQQKEFILDPAKLKALFCTRRSAKSYTAGLYLIYEALTNPGCNCLFTGLTRLSAKGIIWKDILHVIDQQLNLGATFNQTDLTMRLPNGSEIWATGIDADAKEMKKVLGRKFRLACIDEASMYTIDLRGFIYGVLSPAMTDPNAGGERGTICLMGTASDFPTGLFYDVTTGKERGWKLFEWTAHDNPYVAVQWQEALDEIARERPLYMETPQFKQWYLNQWVIDEEKLVYRFSPQRNLTPSIPQLSPDGWSYVLGIDTGWEDDNAFVLTGYHINDPHLYVLKALRRRKLTFDQVADIVQLFMRDPVMSPHKVFIDGANKQGVESMRQRSSIPFEYADKQDKATFIELCNADLVQGKILFHNISENRPLWEEMSSLVWMTDGDKIKFPKKEHPNLPNHLCFIAGTFILTPFGPTPIEDLKIGDQVFTRNGMRRIQNTINSAAHVIKLSLSNGQEIICTPDHPFWSEDRWIPAKDLKPSNPLFHWNDLHQVPKGCLGKGGYTAGIPGDITRGRIQKENQNASIYIGQYGKRIMAAFHMGIIFIIKIPIQAITELKILNACLRIAISQYIHIKAIRKCLIASDISHRHGIGQRKGANGIASMAKIPSPSSDVDAASVGKNISSPICIKESMAAAPQNALLLSDEQVGLMIKKEGAHIAQKISQSINIANKEPAHLHVRNIIELQGERRVYNITVEEDHEYFANAVLVSNCDAFLYAWRNGYHYHSAPAEKKYVVGSREWYQKQSEDIWEKEREKLMADSQQGLWPEETDLSLGDLFRR